MIHKSFITALASTFLLATPATAQAVFENDIARFGGTFARVNAPSPSACSTACAQNSNCMSWTYIEPGLLGPGAYCELKSTVGKPEVNPGAVSGISPRHEQLYAPQRIAHTNSALPPKAMTKPVTKTGTIRTPHGQTRVRTVIQQPYRQSGDGSALVGGPRAPATVTPQPQPASAPARTQLRPIEARPANTPSNAIETPLSSGPIAPPPTPGPRDYLRQPRETVPNYSVQREFSLDVVEAE